MYKLIFSLIILLLVSCTSKNKQIEISDFYNLNCPELEKKLNSAVFPGSQGGPLMHVIAAKAVCFKEALEPDFKIYTQQVIDNAKLMCKVIQDRGIDIVTGKTDNHIVLMDLRKKELTGKDIELALGQANIINIRVNS